LITFYVLEDLFRPYLDEPEERSGLGQVIDWTDWSWSLKKNEQSCGECKDRLRDLSSARWTRHWRKKEGRSRPSISASYSDQPLASGIFDHWSAFIDLRASIWNHRSAICDLRRI